MLILVVCAQFLAGGSTFGQIPDTSDTAGFVITAGETLYSLAGRLRMSADSLSVLNPDLPGRLRAGDVIRVPKDRTSRRITVQRGETLFAISRRYRVSMKTIQNANKMSGTNLRSGQTLIIPGQGFDADRRAGILSGSGVADLEIIESGVAVVYPETYIGRMTASGRPYRPDRFIISHPDLGIGSIVLVSSPATGRETFAEIADRGFRGEPQIIDVSEVVARHLWPDGMEAGGVDTIIEIRAVEMVQN